MNPLEQLNAYLRRLEARLRTKAFTQGAAVLGVCALFATVALVLITNQYAFSDRSLLVARIALFLCLAFALGFGLIQPLIRLNRRRTARHAERLFPEFEEKLLTVAERDRPGEPDPFLELVADDALEVARTAQPKHVVGGGWIAGFLTLAAAALITLVWLMIAGPGYFGYGASLLWAGAPKEGVQPFYDITVTPGDKTVRRRSDQLVTARLIGFQTEVVRLFARYHGTSKWEEVRMQPEAGSPAYGFLFAGLPESVDYYVAAGAVRSKQHTLQVVDLPSVKRIRVTYHFPAWAGLKDVVEEQGGDLRAVEGTEAELAIETDRPLRDGLLVLDENTEISLSPGEGNWSTGRVRIEKDGLYHVAAKDQGQRVRLSEDFFIEAQKESDPVVRIRRPGRDYRANPIEEVTVQVDAEDDFGLRDVSLHYAVNGGSEQVVPVLKQKGAKQASGGTIIYLEDFKLVPGDLVSLYATAQDARTTSKTDIFFIEAQPFEREFSQSQQAGGGGGGQQDQNQISPRQKEIIAATWNELRDSKPDKARAAENGKFLSDVQGKLRDQARSLANRMRSRELSGANQEFSSFSKDMETAAQAMGEAVDKLKTLKWREALVPEQRALQHLLRAEATFRKIQVAMGSRGGGGGGGGMGRDLENLFDLELDTEKNQYETGQQSASADQRAREIDEALQKLEQLAKRQQELAARQRQPNQSFQQRWQQEMLRREAEQLQRRMEQLTRGSSSQSGQQSQSSTGGQSGQQQAMSRQQRSQGQSAGEARLQQALERLRQATEDMRRASASSSSGDRQSEAESRRAAERLQEATDLLSRLRRQEASQELGEMANKADQLAQQQRDFADRLGRVYKAQGGQPSLQPQPGVSRQQLEKLAEEKRQMAEELARLERQMQDAVRDLAGTQRAASSKLREALGEMQQNELGLRMKYGAEWIRRGLGAYTWLREAPVTAGMERLRDQVREAERALDSDANSQGDLEKALAQVEQLRNQMERLAQGARRDQQGNQQGARQGQQGGQQGQQQGGQQGQGGQQAQGGQQGQGGGQRGAYGGPGGIGGPRFAGGGPRSGDYSAMNTGDRQIPDPGMLPAPSDIATMDRTYREGIHDLSQLRQSLRDNPEVARDIQDLIREMQQLDPKRFPGNPELVERLRTQVLPGLEQIELQLRRKLDDEQTGQVRSGLSRPVPPGYADAVAEYFRKLSKSR